MIFKGLEIQFVTVHGEDVTVYGKDVTVHGEDVIVHGEDVTVHGEDVTEQYLVHAARDQSYLDPASEL